MPGTDFVVLKFGGTSVASSYGWATIQERVESLLSRHRVWIVVSALSQVGAKQTQLAEIVAIGLRRAQNQTHSCQARAGHQQPGAGPKFNSIWTRRRWLDFIPIHSCET
jgi:aspartokinase